MAKIKEIKKTFEDLFAYVKCQRTDLQPIFMSRLIKGFNELKEVINHNGRKRKKSKGRRR